MLPGGIVGMIVGYATQRFGAGAADGQPIESLPWEHERDARAHIQAQFGRVAAWLMTGKKKRRLAPA